MSGSSNRCRLNWTTPGRERLLQAALGLTLGEAENVFAKIIVKDERLSGDDVNEVFAEKQQIIRKSGLLEYYATERRLFQRRRLGGAQGLAEQARRGLHGRGAGVRPARAERHSHAGRAGLRQKPVRQGGFTQWQLPLLRFDMGRMFGSLVGSSEENVRRAIAVAESVAPGDSVGGRN